MPDPDAPTLTLSVTTLLFAAGAATAIPLLGFLAAAPFVPGARLWPTPGRMTWQSIVFWTLFRTLNVATLALALASLSGGSWLGIAYGVKAAGAGIAAGSGVLYLCSLYTLGRANTYCASGGLVTRGVYRWTRNPQYATAIPAFAGLAVATDSAAVFLLAAALITVYVLMAHAEEPWLASKYGESYRRYATAVPRFLNVRRARALGHMVRRRLGAPRATLIGKPRSGRLPPLTHVKPRRLSHS